MKRTIEFPITAQAKINPDTKTSTRANDSFLPSGAVVEFPVPVEFVQEVSVTSSHVVNDVICGNGAVTDAIFVDE